MAEHLYAEHIYDSTRREIAIELMEKEMSKQMPSVNLDDVREWVSNLDENTFWNAVEGFMGGALLKPIVHFLTAENYTWSKREIQLEDIQLSSPLTQLDSIDGLSELPPLLKEVKAYLEKNPGEQENQLATIESFSHGKDQDSYPVLIVEKSNGPMVMDGNRRTLHALLTGESQITAWYCETNGQQPRNFWYPVDDMMRLVNIYNSSKESDPNIKENVQQTFQALFSQSDVARQTFEERIVKAGKSGAKDLLV
jgi:hypothetical protein